MNSNPWRVIALLLLEGGWLSAPALAAERARNDRPIRVESRPASPALAAAPKYGAEAAWQFAAGYRGEVFTPNTLYCYPDAVGVPFGDCENIVPMTAVLWTPKQLRADFERRMAALPAGERKRGIIVLLKTERCAPKALRACTNATAALEKRSSPLAAEFLIYGALLKPRDGDRPPGRLTIETGADAWKNEAAGLYEFQQGPGATLCFLNPADGARIARTDASALRLGERDFQRRHGETPLLHAQLQEVLAAIERPAGR